MKKPSEYVQFDLSGEEYREVITANGTYRINNPKLLVIRKGGTTHRVLDADGVVHCYAKPESGKTVIRWKARKGQKPIQF